MLEYNCLQCSQEVCYYCFHCRNPRCFKFRRCDLKAHIFILNKQNIRQVQIANELGVTKQYVNLVLKEKGLQRKHVYNQVVN